MPTTYVSTPAEVRSLIESAIVENAPLVMLYNTGDTTQRARVIWPQKMLTNKQVSNVN
jgi:predicted DNA-binding transcriptional regulator YafY